MKKAVLIIVSALVVISIFGYFILSKKEDVSYTTALVEKGSILQTVSETGTVKAANEIELSFLNSGKIAKIEVSIGDKVKKDQALAELDYSALGINKNEAQASLDIASEDLNKLLAGATSEEIEVARANVKQAKSSYESANKELEKIQDTVEENISQAEKNLYDLKSSSVNNITSYEQAVIAAETTLKNTKSTYQRAIDNKIETAITTIDNNLSKADTVLDAIDRTINDPDGKDFISLSDNKIYLNKTKDAYDAAMKNLSNSLTLLLNAEKTNTSDDVLLSLNNSLDTLSQIFKTLQYCYTALEYSVTSSSFSQTELDALKTNISTEITNITTAITSVQTAKQNLSDSILNYETNLNSSQDSLIKAQASYNDAIINSENALATAKVSGSQQIAAAETKVSSYLESWEVSQAELNRITASANKYDVALAQAQVKKAQAALDSVQKQIENSIIKAPIDGTITKIEYEIGEQAASGITAIAMLAENNFEIEVLISEADISKISKGDKAEITLDSFGTGVKFNGLVYFIEPAETEVQDVVYYKVKVSFDPEEKLIKSGMTANVLITTAQKDEVLIIPSRAIVEKNGQGKIVRVLENNKIEERQISAGLQGDGGLVEILSGLNQGEKVVTSIKENGK